MYKHILQPRVKTIKHTTETIYDEKHDNFSLIDHYSLIDNDELMHKGEKAKHYSLQYQLATGVELKTLSTVKLPTIDIFDNLSTQIENFPTKSDFELAGELQPNQNSSSDNVSTIENK